MYARGAQDLTKKNPKRYQRCVDTVVPRIFNRIQSLSHSFTRQNVGEWQLTILEKLTNHDQRKPRRLGARDARRIPSSNERASCGPTRRTIGPARLEAAEKIDMTSHAWIRGVKNMLICAVGLYGTFAVITWIIARSLDLSPFIATVACGVAAWLLIFIAFVSTWVYQNQIAGAVLLDCGAHAGRKLFMIQAVIFALVASFVRRLGRSRVSRFVDLFPTGLPTEATTRGYRMATHHHGTYSPRLTGVKKWRWGR